MRSDLELLEAWRTGDRVAAGELFDRHAASIYRFFANKVDRDIEDLVQATLMGCVKGRDRIKDGAHFRAYLFGTARNVLRTYLHKRGRLPHADLALSSVHDLGLGPSKVVAHREEQRLLLEALRSVPVESQLLLEQFADRPACDCVRRGAWDNQKPVESRTCAAAWESREAQPFPKNPREHADRSRWMGDRAQGTGLSDPSVAVSRALAGGQQWALYR